MAAENGEWNNETANRQVQIRPGFRCLHVMYGMWVCGSMIQHGECLTEVDLFVSLCSFFFWGIAGGGVSCLFPGARLDPVLRRSSVLHLLFSWF